MFSGIFHANMAGRTTVHATGSKNSAQRNDLIHRGTGRGHIRYLLIHPSRSVVFSGVCVVLSASSLGFLIRFSFSFLFSSFVAVQRVVFVCLALVSFLREFESAMKGTSLTRLLDESEISKQSAVQPSSEPCAESVRITYRRWMVAWEILISRTTIPTYGRLADDDIH